MAATNWIALNWSQTKACFAKQFPGDIYISVQISVTKTV
jgi:hypothetical protein